MFNIGEADIVWNVRSGSINLKTSGEILLGVSLFFLSF